MPEVQIAVSAIFVQSAVIDTRFFCILSVKLAAVRGIRNAYTLDCVAYELANNTSISFIAEFPYNAARPKSFVDIFLLCAVDVNLKWSLQLWFGFANLHCFLSIGYQFAPPGLYADKD